MNATPLIPEATAGPTRRPSVLSANALYLLSMGLVITAGSLLQSWSLSWGLLATELGLILLPALVFTRRAGLPARTALQLRWPGVRPLILAAFVGLGMWGLAILLESVSAALLGYTPPSPFAALPTDPVTLAVFALALAVAAPVCEEVFFRGYLLSAYGRLGPRAGLIAVSLLFAFFHLRLQGLLALLPIAFALGYLAQRTRSLAPAIVAHAVNNGLSAALVIATGLRPGLTTDPVWQAILVSLLAGGLLLAPAALWLLRRGESAQPAPAPVPPAGAPARAFWPLAVAAGLYLVLAGLELVDGRFPQWLAEPALTLGPAPWSQPVTLSFDLRNVLDETVGQAECTLTPEGETVAFVCLTRQRAFEARLGSSFYAGGRYELRQAGRWRSDDLHLVGAQLQFDGEYGAWSAALASTAAGLSLTRTGAAPLAVPAESVVAAEWPWRLMALAFERPFYWGSRLTLVPLRPGDGQADPEAAVVLLRGQATVSTDAGPLRAWKVMLGAETAWYRVDSPHDLVQYSDGYGVTWVRR